jgi:hypothetical protein
MSHARCHAQPHGHGRRITRSGPQTLGSCSRDRAWYPVPNARFTRAKGGVLRSSVLADHSRETIAGAGDGETRTSMTLGAHDAARGSTLCVGPVRAPAVVRAHGAASPEPGFRNRHQPRAVISRAIAVFLPVSESGPATGRDTEGRGGTPRRATGGQRERGGLLAEYTASARPRSPPLGIDGAGCRGTLRRNR